MPVGFQRVIGAIGIVVLSPLLAGLAVAVRLTSPGPVLHRAERVSRRRTFVLHKFRSMEAGSGGSGPGITVTSDPRITRFGRVLRRTRLDELPQLWNVVRGDMALVGPRPEDPRFVDWDDPLHRLVFGALPGITGPTALLFRDEERMLAEEASRFALADGRSVATREEIERAYREWILPRKLALDADYLATRSLHGDVAILLRTVAVAVGRS